MDLSVFQPYSKPKTGFCAHYKKIIDNGRILVTFRQKEEFTLFTRIWFNQFGGGGGKTMILLHKLPCKGAFTLPVNIYEKMVESAIVYDSRKNYSELESI